MLAHLRPADALRRSPFFGANRKWSASGQNDAIAPSRTWTPCAVTAIARGAPQMTSQLATNQFCHSKLKPSCAMAHFVIRCPRTSSNVQVWVSESTSIPKTDEYEGVICPACTRLHFVHKLSGKLLGEK